jgi:hypothetical protein
MPALGAALAPTRPDLIDLDARPGAETMGPSEAARYLGLSVGRLRAMRDVYPPDFRVGTRRDSRYRVATLRAWTQPDYQPRRQVG